MRPFVLALALVPVLAASAQQHAAQPPAGANWQHVQALPAGASISVEARTTHANCNLKVVTADSLTCTHGKDLVFQRADILTIKIPHRGRSTLAGLAIGAGAGLITGYAVTAGQGCSNNCIIGRGTVASAGALGLGAIGAIVGVLTDFTHSTVYKAP